MYEYMYKYMNMLCYKREGERWETVQGKKMKKRFFFVFDKNTKTYEREIERAE